MMTRPIIMPLSEGQMSDHKDACIVLNALPKADYLIADNGYDSIWFREEFLARGIEPCIPSSKGRKKPYAKLSIVADTRSRTYSPNSRTGGVSRHAMTDVHTPSSLQSASQLRSSSGCN